MGKYNELEIEAGGVRYIFVTRGRSKAFTLEEASEYLANRLGRPGDTKEVQDEPAWQIPDDKRRKLMFLKDLNMGMEFCKNKYGVDEKAIIAEARRIAPHLTLRHIDDKTVG